MFAIIITLHNVPLNCMLPVLLIAHYCCVHSDARPSRGTPMRVHIWTLCFPQQPQTLPDSDRARARVAQLCARI